MGRGFTEIGVVCCEDTTFACTVEINEIGLRESSIDDGEHSRPQVFGECWNALDSGF